MLPYPVEFQDKVTAVKVRDIEFVLVKPAEYELSGSQVLFIQLFCYGNSVHKGAVLARFDLAAASVASFLVDVDENSGEFRKRDFLCGRFCSQCEGLVGGIVSGLV